MKDILGLSIDMSKIDEARVIPSKKPGSQSRYMSAVAIPLKQRGQYGNDYMIVEAVSKAERDSGIRGTILGNAKILNGQTDQPSSKPKQQPMRGGPSVKHTAPSEKLADYKDDDKDDQIPF